MNRRTFLKGIGVGLLTAGCAAPTVSPTAQPAAQPTAIAPAATAPPKVAAPTQAPATPKALEKVTMRLDWLIGGQHAPYYLAKEKAYYREVGLDVDITEAQGSTQVLQLVGAKSGTFGYADCSALLKAIAQGIPVKAMAGIVRTSSLGFVFLKETGIRTPKDLEGKTYGMVAGGASAALWPAFVKVNSIDVSKIKIVNIDVPNADRLILSGQIDFTDGVAGGESTYLTAGKEGGFLSFTDSGLVIVGYGLVVHNDTIKEKPETVRGFVTASLKGLDDARKDPQGAVETLLKVAGSSMEERRKPQSLQLLRGVLGGIDSPNTKGKPLGWMSDKDWQSTVDALVVSGGLPKPVELKDAFTNEFVPAM